MDGGPGQQWNCRVCHTAKCCVSTLHQLLPGLCVWKEYLLFNEILRRGRRSRRNWLTCGTMKSMAALTRRGTSTTSPRTPACRTSQWCTCRTPYKRSPKSYWILTPSQLMALSASLGDHLLALRSNNLLKLRRQSWSHDGSILAYGTSKSGSDWVIRIFPKIVWRKNRTLEYDICILENMFRSQSSSWTWWLGRSMRRPWRKSNSLASPGPMTTRSGIQ